MTDRPNGFAPGPEPAPLVALPPLLRVGAGSASAVPITVTNTASESRELLVLAVGVDQAWLPGPVRTRVLAPGESEQVSIRIAPTAGTLPAEYPLAVTVQSVVPATGRASGAATGLGETSIVVNPRAQLSVDASPEQARLVRSQRIRVTLRNAGSTPATVDLEGSATKGLLVRLAKRQVTVPPGGEERIRGRLVATRPRRIGGPITHSWNVVASTPEIVRQVRGSAQQRALLGSGLMKAVAVVAVVAIWVAAVLVLVPQVTEKFGKDKEVAESADGGSGGADGSGDGGSGDGSGSGGSGGGGKVKVTQAKSSASPGGVQVNGTVAADKPAGVTVTLKGISLVDGEAQTAENFGEVADTAQLSSSGKTSPASFLLQLPQQRSVKKRRPACSAVAQCSAVTTDDGTWSIPDVEAPGYYLVTFAKPGYESQRFVIDAATFDPTEPLEIEMLPGDGGLSGLVRGPSGKPLGGATVTVSDGTSTITTSTASRGRVGRWEVSGLETPASYLVEVSSFGLGTESRLVDLGPSEEGTADMRLQAGIAVLRGKIAGKVSDGSVEGLGGVTVSVSDSDGNERSATTVTTGRFTGTFRLPGLTAPGDYTVSLSAPGYQTETRNLSLGKGQGDKRVDASLVSAYGVVGGTVRVRSGGPPIVGAGLTLTDGTHTYKNTSLSRTEATGGKQEGGFRFTGVTPGIYQLTTEYFGFVSSVLTLEVLAGRTTPAQPRLAAVKGGVIPRVSTITGSVIEAGTGELIKCPQLTVAPVTFEPCLSAVVTDSEGDEVEDRNGDPIGTIEFPPDAEYLLPDEDQEDGLVPGLYRVTVSAPHYETASTRVQVGFRDNARAETVQLAPAPIITGNITAAAGRPGSGLPAGQGRTCVWAVPGEVTASDVGSCQAAVDAGCTDTEVTFTPTTTGAQCASVDGVGRYVIEVPRRGQYTVIVKPADTEYVHPEVVRLNAPAGSTLLHNVQLNRFGRVTLTALAAGSGGVLQAVSGATLSLSQGATTFPSDPAGGASNPEGVVFFKRLVPGVYTVNGSNGTRAADPFTVVVGYNQDVERIVPLIRRVTSLVGKVTTNIGGAQDVSGARVELVGPVGYAGTQPYNGSVDPVTAGDGCFVVTRTSSTPSGIGSCVGPYSFPAWKTLDLLSNTVSEIRITKTGFDQLIVRNVDLDEAGVNPFTLEPSGVTFVGNTAGTRITTEGTVPNYANVTFSVDSTTTSAATLSVRAAANGDLTWTDTRYPTTNRIRPGSYTISASLPGYTNDSVTVTCAVATTTPATSSTCSPSRSLQLRQYGSLRVNAVDSTATAVNDAVVTLSKGAAVAGQRTSANDGNTVTFPELVPGATDYSVRVQAAGFDFDAASLSCTPDGGAASASLTIEAGKLTTCEVTLTRLGTFKGTLNGVLADSPAATPFRELAGATVQATPCTTPVTPTSCTAVDASRRLTTTTDAAGDYAISGTNRIKGIDQGWWLITTVLPGWSQAPASGGGLPGTLVEVTSGGDLPQDLSMYVNRVNFTARINDQGGTRVSDATVKLLQGATEVATVTTPTGSGANAQYDFASVLPGFYTLEVSGGGLVRSTFQIEIQVGVANQSFQGFVSRATNGLTGTVRGSDRPDGLRDVHVWMVKCADTGSVCETTTANGTDGAPLDIPATGVDGSVVFRTVPNGRFVVKFEKIGYGTAESAILTFDHTQAAVPALSLTMSAVQRTVNVSINPSTPSADLTGAQLTLVPAGTTENVAAPPATVGLRSASFGQIRFGCWNIAMTLPADHYGTITLPSPTADATLGCSGNVVVPSTAGASPINVSIGLVETELRVSVTATALPGGGASHPAPTQAKVTVTGPSFSRTLATLPTSGYYSLWVKPGTYGATAEAPAGFNREFWPDGSVSGVVVASGPGHQTAATALTERMGTVGVTVAGATPTRWVRITVDPGSGQTAPLPAGYAAGVVVTSSAVQSFTLPSGNWTFTGTFVTSAGSSTPVTGSVPDSETRDIDQFVETPDVTLAPTYPPPPPPPPGP